MLGEVVLDGLKLPSHIGDYVHLNFLLLLQASNDREFLEAHLVLLLLFNVGKLFLLDILGGECISHGLVHHVLLFLLEAELSSSSLLLLASSFLFATHFKYLYYKG